MIVADSSAAVEFLVGGGDAAERVRTRFAGEMVAAPHLVDVEVAHALRGLVLARKLERRRARNALADLGPMIATRYPHWPVLDRVFDLSDNATAYDAMFLVLAETLGCPLVTCDRKLARVKGAACAVEVIR